VYDVIDETQIREAGRRLSDAVSDGKVILFGSHARGHAGDRSDPDSFVIKPEVENAGLEAGRLMRELRDLRLPLEVIVVSTSDVEDWGNVPGRPRARCDHGGADPRRLMPDHRDLACEPMGICRRRALRIQEPGHTTPAVGGRRTRVGDRHVSKGLGATIPWR